jgi:PAS domain S-box-containing protein
MRDQDFRVVNVNDTFCQALGRNRTEFVGEQNIQSKLGGRLGYELKLQQRRDFLSQGNSWNGEACFLDKQNEQRWFSESTSPFLDRNNKPYQFLSIYVDITDRKRFESQLKMHGNHLQDLVDEQIDDIKYARDEAERANKAKSEFLTNMSHELRTPMHGIISFTTLCLKQFKTAPLDEKKIEKLQKFLANIEISSQRLLTLLNDLLDLSKLEYGKSDFNFVENDLLKLCLQIQNENLAKIEEKQIKFIVNSSTDSLITVCDKDKILQVLSNLIDNAIKFSPEKKPSIYL